ncbi:MAG: rhomboid family intramembrane serine protease, partial [Acidimicrobiia bacterium]|nr:rhomboid family intramembrane serine protease [Acidimicrobiia bacterium]NNL28864.1 rhomboid family intramembrane serine protease [Acidimicrobiia bacterium]
MYPEPTARNRFVVAARLLIPAAVLLWLIEAVDVVLFSSRLESHGIEPRQVDGLQGILFSPFLHDDVGHLVANTAPFLVLGALVMASGMKTFWQVTIGAALIGGS